MNNQEIYISHKKVTRIPMTHQQYNDYRGWVLPANEDGSDEGYLVEYLDGGKPNHPDHEGYISWSPKEQFDNGYKKVPSNFMERVIDEKRDLDEKAKALSHFIGHSDAFETLDPAEQERLKAQNDLMWQYSEVLGDRIKAFNLISECGCRFESVDSNAILLCEACSELPCHNRGKSA